jgi:hypothetical protein
MPVPTNASIGAQLLDPPVKQALLDGRAVTNGLTATAGGAQVGALLLQAPLNRVTTVGTAADSVMLPQASAGMRVVVVNAAAANAMAVFPWVGDAINAGAANASFSVAANKVVEFFCAVNGTWNSLLTA